ncbi:hypothetical protein HGRIS_001586 [Hohenbuehelia grisea]|uniref:Uncharacterized protein n=1 Tax=Hohenbuehelia grisea TaxID=104357 RepID=A0ABR3JPQ9_9AGAR
MYGAGLEIFRPRSQNRAKTALAQAPQGRRCSQTLAVTGFAWSFEPPSHILLRPTLNQLATWEVTQPTPDQKPSLRTYTI